MFIHSARFTLIKLNLSTIKGLAVLSGNTGSENPVQQIRDQSKQIHLFSRVTAAVYCLRMLC